MKKKPRSVLNGAFLSSRLMVICFQISWILTFVEYLCNTIISNQSTVMGQKTKDRAVDLAHKENSSEMQSSLSLEQRYDEMMRGRNCPTVSYEWEKSGDIYKQYSLYDHSKYETKTETIIL